VKKKMWLFPGWPERHKTTPLIKPLQIREIYQPELTSKQAGIARKENTDAWYTIK
jgi:hypothetical protein